MADFQLFGLICLMIAFALLCTIFVSAINFEFDDEKELRKKKQGEKSLRNSKPL
jgi:hypothetical protein